MKNKYEGISLSEVWVYDSFSVIPTIMRLDGTWQIFLHNKQQTDGNSVPVEIIKTDIPVEDGDIFDRNKIKKCYQMLAKSLEKYRCKK